MVTEFPRLFEPITIRHTRIRNRVVMSAMNENLAALDGSVTQHEIDYFAARAGGGVGMIVTGNAFIDDEVSRVSAGEIGAHDNRMILGLGRLAEEVQNRGATLIVQLAHSGVQTMSETIGFRQVVAPSAVEFIDVARELAPTEIHQIVASFAAAAARVDRAGATGVEVHAGHGYLLSSFISPRTNRRTDHYGGSLENRLRIVRDTIALIRESTSDRFIVGVKFNSSDMIEGGLEIEEAIEVAKGLEAAGVDYLNVSRGVGDSVDTMMAPLYYPRQVNVAATRRIRDNVSIPVITVGSVHDPSEAEEIIVRGDADLVAIGRSILADPEWVLKARRGATSSIRPCIRCNECVTLVDENREVRCAVNPWVGREATRLEPAAIPRHLVIVGGGPSGCEAALIAAKRGHQVTLLERRDRLGGASVPDHNPSFKLELNRLPAWYAQELAGLGVTVLLEHSATAESVVALKPDVVAYARGGMPLPVDAPQDPQAQVIQAIDLLQTEPGTDQDVVVVGAGFVGCETAVHLAQLGNRVRLLTRRSAHELATDLNITVRIALTRLLEETQVEIIPRSDLCEVMARSVRVESEDGHKTEVPADLVVIARGFTQDTSIADDLRSRGYEVHEIGETVRTGLILNAVHQGFAFGLQV